MAANRNRTSNPMGGHPEGSKGAVTEAAITALAELLLEIASTKSDPTGEAESLYENK